MFEELDGVTVARMDLGGVAGALPIFEALPMLEAPLIFGTLPALGVDAVTFLLGGTADGLSVLYI
jgi:hypothetical protein